VEPLLLNAAVGGMFRVISTSSELSPQPLLVIVQRKVFVPVFNPLTVVLGSVLFANVPAPEITDHVPVPVAGVFAASVALPVHKD